MELGIKRLAEDKTSAIECQKLEFFLADKS
jgi:hypothetical protein